MTYIAQTVRSRRIRLSFDWSFWTWGAVDDFADLGIIIICLGPARLTVSGA